MKSTLIYWIASQDLGTVFKCLPQIIVEYSYYQHDLLMLLSRYNTLVGNQIKGLVSQSETNIEYQQIMDGLLKFIQQLPEVDINESAVLQLNHTTIKPQSGEKPSFQQLNLLSKHELDAYIDLYKRGLAQQNADHSTYIGLGLCYLHLKLPDLAIKTFSKAQEAAPDAADTYYYLSLAKIRNRRIGTLSLPMIRDLESGLQAAISLDSRIAVYYALWYLIKQDYYLDSGLNPGHPSPEDLLQYVHHPDFMYDDGEIDRLLYGIIPPPQAITQRIRR
ncbi:MAG: hypothetical protein SF053_00545 [Bacteroidia bacterium]|nr:hypothetical protein [Bacteroidia bacterium]